MTEAVFVCFDLGLLQTTQVGAKPASEGGPFIPLDFAICYPAKRLAYVSETNEKAKSPPHASCIVYLPGDPQDRERFVREFSKLGRVVVPQGE